MNLSPFPHFLSISLFPLNFPFTFSFPLFLAARRPQFVKPCPPMTKIPQLNCNIISASSIRFSPRQTPDPNLSVFLSYPTLFYPIPSFLIPPSYPFLSFPILSFPFLSYLIPPSYPFLSFPW